MDGLRARRKESTSRTKQQGMRGREGKEEEGGETASTIPRASVSISIVSRM